MAAAAGANADVEFEDDDMCSTCGHRHVEKCPQCGHNRGKLFFMLRERRYEGSFDPVFFNGAERDQSEALAGHYALARILRRKVMVEELGGDYDAEYAPDADSRHGVGYVGDAPIAVARWRVNGAEAHIDRLVVKDTHRRQGVARRMLQDVVQDVSNTAAAMGWQLAGLSAAVTPAAASVFAAGGFQPAGAAEGGVQRYEFAGQPPPPVAS